MVSQLVLGSAPLAVLILAFWWLRKQHDTFAARFAANYSVGIIVGAISLAICWAWVFLFMVGPMRAYQGGVGTFMWFASANIAGLGLFALWSTRGRQIAHIGTCTLTGLVEQQYDRQMTAVYTVGILGIQGVYAVVAQFLGAFLILNVITGVEKWSLVLLVGMAMFALAAWRGLSSSLVGDMAKAGSVAVVAAMFIFIAAHAEWETFKNGLGGIQKNGAPFLDPGLVWGVGIATLISLCAGASVDHQLWQRMFALSPGAAKWSPWFAVPIFAAMVIMVGIPSFLAAGAGLKVAYTGLSDAQNAQLSGFAMITDSFAAFGSLAFVFLLAMFLVVTGASALNAASSTLAVDVWKMIRPDTYQAGARTVSLVVMGILVILGGLIALKTAITLDDMLLFVGPFRAGLLPPLILGLYTWKRKPTSRFFPTGIAAAMLASPVVAVMADPFIGGLVALGATSLLCLFEWARGRTLMH